MTLTLQDEDAEKLPEVPMKKILSMNSPEWHLITVGCLCCIVVGGLQPAFSIVMTEFLDVGIYLKIKQ